MALIYSRRENYETIELDEFVFSVVKIQRSIEEVSCELNRTVIEESDLRSHRYRRSGYAYIVERLLKLAISA